MKELNIPKIYSQESLIGYGGDQEWFDNQWARQAGCASVLASNLYSYYHHQDQYLQDDFLKVMDEMFQLMTPGKIGYPFLYRFARTFVKRMKEDDIHLVPVYQKKSHNYQQALQFVLKSIDDNHPIGMLILHHRAEELKDDNWHWVCLTGYQETKQGYEIIFSDCGERRTIDAQVLFDVHHKNIFKMVRMKGVA